MGLVAHHQIHVLGALGHVAREVGDHAQATALYQESLRLRREQGDALATAYSLEDFAGLAGRQRRLERAVRLLGAAQAVCQTLGRTLAVGVKEEYERTLAAAHAALSEEVFAETWEEGRAMTWVKAAQYALQGVGPGLVLHSSVSPAATARLTPVTSLVPITEFNCDVKVAGRIVRRDVSRSDLLSHQQ